MLFYQMSEFYHPECARGARWDDVAFNIRWPIPKPMVLIGNKPILWHIMKIYSHQGFNEFIICLGEKASELKI